MKTLLLIRHAKSSWDARVQSDADRPLNRRGRGDAPAIGRKLAQFGQFPDLIISSPARRASNTAFLVALELGYDTDQIRSDERIYEAVLPTLLDVVTGIDPEFGTVALVGHNPGITELANCLTGERIENVPTCGVVTVSLDCDRWIDVAAGSGRQLDFIYPKLFDDL